MDFNARKKKKDDKGGLFFLLLLGAGAVLLAMKGGGSSGALATISSVVLSSPAAPGEFLDLFVTWIPKTKDAAGNYIPWNYRMRGVLHLEPAFGGDQALEAHEVVENGTPGNLQKVAPFSSKFLGPFNVPVLDLDAYGASYTMYADIFVDAAQSDADGNPTAVWLQQATLRSNRITINQNLMAQPGLVVSSAVLSQNEKEDQFFG